jgi:predicted lysophospholipase L1 biosynthesis ABC-type transport system permease subunit
MRVVGEALAPIFGEADLGDVGLVTLAGLEAAGGKSDRQLFLVTLKDRSPGTLRSFDNAYTEEIATDVIAARIVNLHRVRRLPLIGLLLAGLLGTMLLAYTLTLSARARSRELAVMRTLGLPSKRVRRILAWEGALLGTGMLVIGIPIGLVAGSALWNVVADDLGVHDVAIITPLLFLLVPLTLLVAIGASLYPARRARRAPVAEVLRVE